MANEKTCTLTVLPFQLEGFFRLYIQNTTKGIWVASSIKFGFPTVLVCASSRAARVTTPPWSLMALNIRNSMVSAGVWDSAISFSYCYIV
jgi:hypothetical protein